MRLLDVWCVYVYFSGIGLAHKRRKTVGTICTYSIHSEFMIRLANLFKELLHLTLSDLTSLVVPRRDPSPFVNNNFVSLRCITLECQSTNVMAYLHDFSGKISGQVFDESQSGWPFWTSSTF
jgi:hypothetical protein